MPDVTSAAAVAEGSAGTAGAEPALAGLSLASSEEKTTAGVGAVFEAWIATPRCKSEIGELSESVAEGVSFSSVSPLTGGVAAFGAPVVSFGRESPGDASWAAFFAPVRAFENDCGSESSVRSMGRARSGGAVAVASLMPDASMIVSLSLFRARRSMHAASQTRE